MNTRMLVIGYCYMEMVIWTDAIPTAEVAVSEHNSYTMRPGGRAGCAAIAAGRIGVDTALCSVVGKDANGSRLLDYYSSNGVNTSFLKTDRRGTGISVHLHENSFQSNRKILCPTANTTLDGDWIAHAMESEPSAAYLTTELAPELLVDACHMAKLHGIPVYLDAQGMKPFSAMGNLENLELFITDAAGVRSMTGVQLLSPDKCLPAAVALESRVRSKYYIFRLGSKGTFIYDGKYQYHVIPCALDEKYFGAPIDTEAAAIAASYLVTGDIRNSCALAAVMAKMAREDPKIKIPTMAQAVDYCRLHGIRFTR